MFDSVLSRIYDSGLSPSMIQVFGAGVGGVVLSILIGIFFVLEPMRSRVKDKVLPFEMEYYDEYDALLEQQEKTPLQLDENAHVKVGLPLTYGDIILTYNAETESFVYYCRTANVPYKYLETVARKFVVDYGCPNLYVDIRREYEVAVARAERNKAGAGGGGSGGEGGEGEGVAAAGGGGEEASEQQSVFANFKSYNRKHQQHQQQQHGQKQAEMLPDLNTTTAVLREKANRYSYRGKVEEWEEGQRVREEKRAREEKLAKENCGSENIVDCEGKSSYKSFKSYAEWKAGMGAH